MSFGDDSLRDLHALQRDVPTRLILEIQELVILVLAVIQRRDLPIRQTPGVSHADLPYPRVADQRLVGRSLRRVKRHQLTDAQAGLLDTRVPEGFDRFVVRPASPIRDRVPRPLDLVGVFETGVA